MVRLLRAPSGRDSWWSASHFAFICKITSLFPFSCVAIWPCLIIMLVFQCVSTFSDSGIQGKWVWPGLLHVLFKHKHIQAESRLGEGGGVCLQRGPLGSCKEGPRQEPHSLGQSWDICPLSCTKDCEARHCCCCIRLLGTVQQTQLWVSGRLDTDLNQHGPEPALHEQYFSVQDCHSSRLDTARYSHTMLVLNPALHMYWDLI